MKIVIDQKWGMGMLPQVGNDASATTNKTMKLIRQSLSITDCHPRYKSPCGTWEVFPRYAGHGERPTHYTIKKSGKIVDQYDTLKECREYLATF